MNDERTSFDALVLPHLADALALARWLTKSRHDAEDVVQEACLRAFNAIGTYAGGAPRAWLLAIVRNTAYSWLEKNRRREIVSVDELDQRDRDWVERGGDSIGVGAKTPETDLLAKADVAQIQRAIERLPLEFRETLVLRDIQGLEYREIAEVTAVPIGTVTSRLSRARRLLFELVTGPAGKAEAQMKTEQRLPRRVV